MLAPTPREFDRFVPRGLAKRRNLGRAALAIALILGLLVWMCGVVRAGDDDDDPEDEAPVKRPPIRKTSADDDDGDSPSGKPSSVSSPLNTGAPNDGLGVDFIGGFSYGQGVVQDRPLAPIEAFPSFLMNDSLYFGDLRFYPTIDGTFGGMPAPATATTAAGSTASSASACGTTATACATSTSSKSA